MSVQQQGQIAALVGWLVLSALIVFRKRLGVLNAASWLVVWGSVVLFTEHPQWTITIALGFAEGREMAIVHMPAFTFLWREFMPSSVSTFWE